MSGRLVQEFNVCTVAHTFNRNHKNLAYKYQFGKPAFHNQLGACTYKCQKSSEMDPHMFVN